MIGGVSPRVSSLAAVALAALVGWGMLGLVWSAASARIAISRQADEARENYTSVRQRRVDIQSLRDRLAGLSASDTLRASSIEAPDERGAVGLLRQAARAAVEGANGKFLSSTEFSAIKIPDTVAIQVRARSNEAEFPAVLRAIEQGERSMLIDDIQLTAKQPKADAAEIEIVAVLRMRWRTVEKRSP